MNTRLPVVMTISLLLLLLSGIRLDADSWVRRIEAQAPVLGVGVAPMGSSFVAGWRDERTTLTLFDIDGEAKASVRLAHGAIIRTMSAMEDGSVMVAGQVPTVINGEKLTSWGVVHLVAPDGRVERKTDFAVIDTTGSGEALARTAIGACRAGGYTYVVGQHGNEAAMLARLEPSGHTDWVRVYDWPDLDELATVVCTDDGGAIAGGMVGGPMPVIMRVDSEGRLIWRTIFGSIRGRFLSLRPDGSGSIIAAGVMESSGTDILVASIGLDGKPAWVRNVGSPRNEVAVSAHVTPRSTIAVGGFVYGETNIWPVAIELRPDGTLIRSEEITAAQVPASLIVAASPDASGELAFALATETSIVISRWDGTLERSCGADAGMTASDVAPGLTTMSEALPEPNTYSTPWAESSPREVDVKAARVECDGSTQVQQSAAAENELTFSRMALQAAEEEGFGEEVWRLFVGRRWDELEAMAVDLRPKNETWPSGDWKLYEFYDLLGHAADGSPAFALRKEWIEARPNHTALRIAMAEAHLDLYRADSGDEDLEIVREQLNMLPDDLVDPELVVLHQVLAWFTGDEWWDEFEQGSKIHPGHYRLYAQATQASLRDKDRLARVIEHARSTGQAIGWGDSLVARVMNVLPFYVDARDWPFTWKEIQTAYRDLFVVYPESYKNMFRYGMLACNVRDRSVARSIFMNPEVDGPHDVPVWSGTSARELVRECMTWAMEPPAGLWAEPPAIGEDGLSQAEFNRTARLPSDPTLAEFAGRMLDLVSVNVSGWPKLVIDSSDDTYQGVEAGFFARASNSTMCFVTASESGVAPALRVRQADGSLTPMTPLPMRDAGAWKAALYRADQAGLIELRTSGRRPKPLMTVLAISLGQEGQVVSRGLIFRADGEEPGRAAPKFSVILRPGSPLPPAGSPVLYDNANLAGIVIGSSIADGWVVVECETAERVLNNLR